MSHIRSIGKPKPVIFSENFRRLPMLEKRQKWQILKQKSSNVGNSFTQILRELNSFWQKSLKVPEAKQRELLESFNKTLAELDQVMELDLEIFHGGSPVVYSQISKQSQKKTVLINLLHKVISKYKGIGSSLEVLENMHLIPKQFRQEFSERLTLLSNRIPKVR